MAAAESEVAAEATKKAKAEVETVTMSDGRKVDFAGKRKLLKESLFGDDGSVSVRLDFRNGETRTYVLPAELVNKFAAHGAEQKLGDETAGIDDVDDMVLQIDELIGRLTNIEGWSIRREGTGMAGTSILLCALMEYTNRTQEQIKEFLNGNPEKGIAAKTQAEKLALRSSPKVKPIIERLESEKASKGPKVDTDALLASIPE